MLLLLQKTARRDLAGQALPMERFARIYGHKYQGRINDRPTARGKDMSHRKNQQWQIAAWKVN